MSLSLVALVQDLSRVDDTSKAAPSDHGEDRTLLRISLWLSYPSDSLKRMV